MRATQSPDGGGPDFADTQTEREVDPSTVMKYTAANSETNAGARVTPGTGNNLPLT